jgi:hypothetical protein
LFKDQIGSKHQTGVFVWGLEADIQASDLKYTSTGVPDTIAVTAAMSANEDSITIEVCGAKSAGSTCLTSRDMEKV